MIVIKFMFKFILSIEFFREYFLNICIVSAPVFVPRIHHEAVKIAEIFSFFSFHAFAMLTLCYFTLCTFSITIIACSVLIFTFTITACSFVTGLTSIFSSFIFVTSSLHHRLHRTSMSKHFF